MAFFLLIAGIANLGFLWRAVRDNTGESASGPNRFLLFMAGGELCWVIPCFVQCFIIFVDGNNGAWSPKQEGSGCDVQGFYSVFSATIGQLLGAYGAYIAFQRGQVSTSAATLCCTVIFVVSGLLTALPFMGVGDFTYGGEGFCYYDWYDKTHASITFIISVCTLIFVPVAYAKAYADATEPKLHILMFPCGFWAGWVLWPIASGYGLAESTIPDHMLISGAVLGHLQALVNPILYGIYWRARYAVMRPDTATATASAQLVVVVEGDSDKRGETSGLKSKNSEGCSTAEQLKDGEL